MSDIITETDKYKKGWGGGLPETPCGNGSRLSQTVDQRKWIPEIVQKYNIKTIADIGAGDLNWIKHTTLGDVEYKAYDLVPRKAEVISFDLIKQVPPKVDLIMCLWVLNHFPIEHCRQAVHNLLASGAKYILMTDRERYREFQPSEHDTLLSMTIDKMVLNEKNDSIRLIKL